MTVINCQCCMQHLERAAGKSFIVASGMRYERQQGGVSTYAVYIPNKMWISKHYWTRQGFSPMPSHPFMSTGEIIIVVVHCDYDSPFPNTT